MARKATPQRGAASRTARGEPASARKTARGATAKTASSTRKTSAKMPAKAAPKSSASAGKAAAKAAPKTTARKVGRPAPAPKKAAVKRGGRMTKTTQTTKKEARRTYARPRKESESRRGPTRAALYAEIKKRGIQGCSRMSKEELQKELGKAARS